MCTAEELGNLAVEHDPGAGLPRPRPGRPNLAAASTCGREINLHLGQAPRLLIYGPRADGRLTFLGSRPVPAPNSGINRWTQLAEQLSDCFVVLAAEAGASPRAILAGQGVPVLTGEGRLSDALDVLYDEENQDS